MQSKILLKLSLLIISIVGIASSLAILFVVLNSPGQRALTQPPPISINQSAKNLVAGTSVESSQNIASAQPTSSVLAFRLKIPKINVNATVESVGLTSDGAMDAPKGAVNAAWYNLGPVPGEKGSAVIDGHSGWGNGVAAVFDDLYKLQKGDKVYVEDEIGTVTTFVVRESRSYDPKAGASDVFGSNDGRAQLNLITCEGAWNEQTKSYSTRLVVFTDEINEE